MAEAILKNKQMDEIEVRSAGIYAANGSEASTHAKKVLEDNGIAHNHRSSLLTGVEVNWADLILTMTSSHKMAILQQYPEVSHKVFTLKEYSGERFNSDVVDPYGGSLAMYEQTFRELDELINKSIGKLK